jgi:hypothetical protein
MWHLSVANACTLSEAAVSDELCAETSDWRDDERLALGSADNADAAETEPFRKSTSVCISALISLGAFFTRFSNNWIA